MPFPDPMTNVADFVAMFFGSRLVTDSFESDVSVATTVVQLIAQNPRRVALHLFNTGPTQIVISRVNTLTLTTGQPIAPGESVDLYWYNELREIEKNWFAIGGGAGGSIHIREIVFV